MSDSDSRSLTDAEVIDILRGLLRNPSMNLGDRVYDVREREGLGWDGPNVKAWGAAVTKAESTLLNLEARRV